MKKLLGLALLLSYSLTLSSQQLVATATDAVVNVSITDFKLHPKPKEEIIFESKKTKKIFKTVSGDKGTCSLYLPKGDAYVVKYKSFLNQKEYSSFEIPGTKELITMDLKIQMDEEEKSYVLENVFFDTGKSSLRTESFKALNELAEAMKAKPTLEIEIAGHTDNVGSPESNLKLSQGRADAVRNYLIKNSIAASRVTAKGYGDTEPVAYNDTDEGRQKNRRTEVRILKE
ncbi:MAG: OmpA family protein [Bacteroidia bacterium]